jgi:hypothetical protein
MTSSIASRNGDGVFPCISDCAECSDIAEWVEAADGDGVRSKMT